MYRLARMCNVLYIYIKIKSKIYLFISSLSAYPTPWHRAMLTYTASVREWMAADPRNIIAIHCKGGKGKQGMMGVGLM